MLSKLALVLFFMPCGLSLSQRESCTATGAASGVFCHTCWFAQWYATLRLFPWVTLLTFLSDHWCIQHNWLPEIPWHLPRRCLRNYCVDCRQRKSRCTCLLRLACSSCLLLHHCWKGKRSDGSIHLTHLQPLCTLRLLLICQRRRGRR
jgi:hypothetical protein